MVTSFFPPHFCWSFPIKARSCRLWTLVNLAGAPGPRFPLVRIDRGAGAAEDDAEEEEDDAEEEEDDAEEEKRLFFFAMAGLGFC